MGCTVLLRCLFHHHLLILTPTTRSTSPRARYSLTVVKSAASRTSSAASLGSNGSNSRAGRPATPHRHPARATTATANNNNTSSGGDGSRGGTRAIAALVTSHVPSAQLVSSTFAEAVFRLPREAAPAFAPLLRALEADSHRLGCSSYGLSVTTLEEVFLNVTAQVRGSPPPM